MPTTYLTEKPTVDEAPKLKTYNGLICFSLNPWYEGDEHVTDISSSVHQVSSIYLPDFYSQDEMAESNENGKVFTLFQDTFNEVFDKTQVCFFEVFWAHAPFNGPTYFIQTRELDRIEPGTEEAKAIEFKLNTFIHLLTERHNAIPLESIAVSPNAHAAWNYGRTPHSLTHDQYMGQLALAQKILIEQSLERAPNLTSPPTPSPRKSL